jgi:pimeloyl-ACP methyl ester carboxylesterase
MGPLVRAAFFEIRKERDILLIDQRGSGRTSAVTSADHFDRGSTNFSLGPLASGCLQGATNQPVDSFNGLRCGQC